MLEVEYGNQGQTELRVRFSGAGFDIVEQTAVALFKNPPAGYGAESMTVKKQRSKRRGSRHFGQVLLYHKTNSDELPLSPKQFVEWANVPGRAILNVPA